LDADTVTINAARGQVPTASVPDDAFIAVAADMLSRLDAINAQLVVSIVDGDSSYGPTTSQSLLVSREDLVRSCHDNLRQVLRVLAGLESLAVTLEVPRATGERRAHQGLPLEALLHAYRLGGQVIWQEMVSVLVGGARADGDVQGLLGAATAVWTTVDAFSVAAAAGYRRAESARDIRRDRRLTALVSGLLTGQPVEQEAAIALGLPVVGHFLVVATGLSTGDESAHGARPAMAARGLVSVWRPHGNRDVGILSLPATAAGPRAIDQVIEALQVAATGPIGVSPPVHTLSEVAAAFADATRALDTLPSGEPIVATLGDRLLPAILTHSPDLSARHDRLCLGPLDALPSRERDALVDTLQAWFDSDGDVRRTATTVYCHRNTVHNRLHRITSLTGLSTEAPGDVAMLYLSLLARQLGLGQPDPAQPWPATVRP
jgi:hypothetical protein